MYLAAQFIAEAFLPHLLDPLLSDYAANIPAARNPEVLSVMTSCVLKLKEDMSMHVPKVMAGVFRSTLEMLRVTYVDFPEHRLNFFKLLEGIVNNCFAALFSMDGDTVKMFVDSLMWGFKHPQRDIAETVLPCSLWMVDRRVMCVCMYPYAGLGHLDGCHGPNRVQRCDRTAVFQGLLRFPPQGESRAPCLSSVSSSLLLFSL